MKFKFGYRTLALLLALSITLGVSLHLIAAASEDTSGGFEISMYWNMNDAYTSADKLSYAYHSTSADSKALRLAIRYQNKDMGDAVYAPGEVSLTLQGIGGAFRDGAKAADSIAADKASETSKSYAWSYTYSSATDTYTFTNNYTLSSQSNFAGSFELLWTVDARTSLAAYDTVMQATLRAGGVELKSNQVTYSQTRVKDEFTLQQEAARIYSAEGYANGLNADDYWWLSFTATSQRYARSLGVHTSYFEVLLPEGAAIAYAFGSSFTKTGTITENGVTYDVWRIMEAPHSASGTVEANYIVRYDKAIFSGNTEVQNIVRTMGEYYDLDNGIEELARVRTGDLYYSDFEFLENPPGDIFVGSKTPSGTGAGTTFAREHDTNCYRYGYVDSRHFTNGNGYYTYSLYGSVSYPDIKFDRYNMVFTDETVEAETTDGSYRKLASGEYAFTYVSIPSVSSVTNANGLPVESGVYPVEVYIKTAADSAYTLHQTTVLNNSSQSVYLPSGTVGVQVRILDVKENMRITLTTRIQFTVDADSDLKTTDGNVYNTMLVNLSGYNINDGATYTKANPYQFETLYYYANMHVLEVPNFYYADASLASFGDVTAGAMPSNVTLRTYFDYQDGEELNSFSMYTILPKGMSLPDSVVDTEALYDVLTLSGLGLTETELLRALTVHMDTNYQGSGRIYLEFRFQFSKSVAARSRNMQIVFPVHVTLDDFYSYGPSFRVRNVSIVHDTDLSVNPSRGISTNDGAYASADERDIWSNITRDGQTDLSLSYSDSTRREILQAAAMETGISKLVATESTGNRFVQISSNNGVYDDDEIPMVSKNGTYTYRLRMLPNSQEEDTLVTDIVLFDVLETGKNAKWQGSLVSVDASAAEALLTKLNEREIKATVYYSDVAYTNAVSSDHYKPNLTTPDWGLAPTANTKSIAVSFGDAELTGSEYLTVDITMRAPNIADDDARMYQITENNSGVYFKELNTLAGSEAEIWLPSNDVPVKLMPRMGTLYVTKVDAEDNSSLTGAVFSLYRVVNAGTDELVQAGLASDARGRITIRNLTEGSYYLVETSAPQGYEKMADPYHFTIADSDENTMLEITLENDRKAGTVTLYKTSNKQDIGLAGAVFHLYQSDGTLYQGGLVIGPDGTLVLTGLPWGDYYLVEVTPPAGYTLPENNKFEFTISAENDAGRLLDTIRVEDPQIPASAVLTKYEKLEDGETTTTPVQGATYWLYDAEYNDLGAYVTDADGKIYLEALAFGTYYLKETIAAAGYSLYADLIPFTVTSAHTEIALQITTYDQRLKGNIWLQKFDDAGDYVSGAVYGLFRQGETTPYLTETTNAEGIVEFKNLKWGSYYVKEISSPQGYELDETQYPVEIGPRTVNNTITMTVVDNRIQGSVRLVKTDESGTVLLDGAKFNLYRNDGTLVASDLVTGMNGETGVIEVDGLDWGSYYFEEQQAPTGYGLSDEKVRFSINAANCTSVLELEFINVGQTAEITLTKEIAYDDLVFAHGNPTFTFKVTGQDVNGGSHTWYKSVTFDKAYADANVSGGVVRASVTFTVPMGTYYATEVDVIRYKLSEIKELNSYAEKVSNSEVKFTMIIVARDGDTLLSGKATFVNEKVIQSGTSDAVQINNIIKSGRKLVAISADYQGPETLTGSEIDRDKLTVTAFYDDGTERVLGTNEYTLEHEAFDGYNNGNYTVTVVYTEGGITRRAYFDVKVMVLPPFLWTVENGVATIVAYTGNSTTVNYPAQVNGTWTLSISNNTYKGTHNGDTDVYPVKIIGDGSYPAAPAGTTQIILPDSVERINVYAFMNIMSLTGIVWSQNLKRIDAFSFYYCTGLNGSLVLPDSVETVGISAFQAAGYTGTLTLSQNLVTIKDHAFSDINFGGTLIIPDSVKTIEGSAFAGAMGKTYQTLTGLKLGEGLETIGSYFLNWRSIQGNLLTIPDSVITIEDYAFNGIDFVDSPGLKLGSSVQTIGTRAFYGTSLTGDLIVPDSVQVVGAYAFQGLAFSGTIKMSQGLRSVGTYAFASMTGEFTTDLEIPGTLRTINSYVFQYLNTFGRLILHEGIETIGEYAFRQTSFGSIYYTGDLVIPNSVQTIGTYAFYGGNFDGTLTIGNQVTTIGNNAFGYFNSITGNLVIPDSVLTIGTSAFTNGTFNGTLTLPNYLTSLGASAFASCRRLTGAVVIPQTLTVISSSVFSYCSSITSVTLHDGITLIGSNAFSYCNYLTGDLVLPANLTSLGSGAFENAPLTSVEIPGTVKSIPASTFWAYNSSHMNGGVQMKRVVIGHGVETIGDRAFHYMLENIEEDLVVPLSVTSIAENAFTRFAYNTSAILYLPSRFIGQTVGSSTASKIIYYSDYSELP